MKPVRTAARAMLGVDLRGQRGPHPAQPRRPRSTPPSGSPTGSARCSRRSTRGCPPTPAPWCGSRPAPTCVAGLRWPPATFTRPAAAVLAAGLVPTTLAGHPFWACRKPERAAAADPVPEEPGPARRPAARRRRHRGPARPALPHQRTRSTASQRSVSRAVRTAKRDAKIAALSRRRRAQAARLNNLAAIPGVKADEGPRGWSAAF